MMSSDKDDTRCLVSSSTPLPRPVSFIKLSHFKCGCNAEFNFLRLHASYGRGCLHSCLASGTYFICKPHEHLLRNKQLEVQQLPPNDILNTLRTGDADLRFYITTVQDG
jgi:hypothetical protein